MLFFFCILLVGCEIQETPGQGISDFPQGEGTNQATYLVTEVIDGDTFRLENGETVRLICLDAPERDELYYNEARIRLQELIQSKYVTLETDESNRDQYGRLLRYVYVDDEFVNYEIVRSGLVVAKRYIPDTERCDLIEEAQSVAQEEEQYLWS